VEPTRNLTEPRADDRKSVVNLPSTLCLRAQETITRRYCARECAMDRRRSVGKPSSGGPYRPDVTYYR